MVLDELCMPESHGLRSCAIVSLLQAASRDFQVISVLVEMCKEEVENSQAKAKAKAQAAQAQGRQPSCNVVSIAVAAELRHTPAAEGRQLVMNLPRWTKTTLLEILIGIELPVPGSEHACLQLAANHVSCSM